MLSNSNYENYLQLQVILMNKNNIVGRSDL